MRYSRFFNKNSVANFVLLMLIGFTAGCASVSDVANGLTDAILNQDDPKTVEEGGPAYLLLIDGLIQGDPEDEGRLMAGARLYGAYTSMFVKDPARSIRLMNRARDYSRRAICQDYEKFCAVIDSPFDVFKTGLESFSDEDDVPMLYTFAVIWAGYIKANKSDWGAVADLAKVKACMQKVIELDEGYDNGGPYMYLGLLNTLLPKALGGKPELAKKYFERAIVLSKGRNLMIKVYYAERYARLVFDKKLHDRLLKQVLNAQATANRLTLVNTLAKIKAKKLLASGKEYF